MNKRERAHRFGLNAEKLAAWYLRCKGYRIIAERYRNAQGEIDLLATRGNILAIIEVKARKNFDDCLEAIPPRKQQKIARAVEGLLSGHSKIAGLAGVHNRNIRFDVIWVVRARMPRHMKDAWRP